MAEEGGSIGDEKRKADDPREPTAKGRTEKAAEPEGSRSHMGGDDMAEEARGRWPAMGRSLR